MSLEETTRNYSRLSFPLECMPTHAPIEFAQDFRKWGLHKDTDAYYTNNIGNKYYPLL